MVDSAGLEAILNRLEAGKRLSKQDLQTLVTAVRSQQVTITTGDRAVAIGGSADGAVIVTGDRNFVVAGADAEAIRELMGKRARSESILLQAVEDEVTARLDQSLYEAVSIQLKLEAQPGQVKRFWDSDIKIGDQPAKPIPENWNILKVFQEVRGKLLILGSPGAGKTTTMLELAQKLTIFSKGDEEFPIPVLFNLSTWKDSNQSLQDWFVSELKLKYGVRKDIAKKWVNDTKLLPMLDGLDELESERQGLCIEAINQLLEGDYRPQYLVVCSRWEEYNIHLGKLQLNGAAFIRELTEIQIQNYLETVGRENLYQDLQQDLSLLEVLKAPLFLNIAILSEQELLIDEWKKLETISERRDYLMTSYVKRMMKRELGNVTYTKGNTPDSEKTKQRLSWLAQQLQRESSTEFLIERIQPIWLQGYLQKLFYSTIISLVRWLAIFPLLTTSIFSDFADGIIVGLAGGLLFGIVDSFALKSETIKLIETVNFSIKTVTYKIFLVIISAIDGASGTGNFYGDLDAAASYSASEVELKLTPNQGIFKTLKNLIHSILFVFLYFSLSIFYLYLGSLFPSLFNDGSLQALLYSIIYILIGLVFPVSNLFFRIGVVFVASQSCIQYFIIRFIVPAR